MPRRLSRRRRTGLVAAAVVVAVLVGLWIARRPIATRFIDRELAAAGVPARYGIADLGLGRQRLTDVVLGDPARPDLVADWIETRTRVGLTGARLVGVRAGHVRIRARLANGKVSLGAIDRLLPPPSGKPFALPALDVDVADARMRLDTPYGLVGLKIAGSGVLDDGFAGSVATISDRLAVGGCAAARATAAVRVRIRDARPTLTGPIGVGALACGETRIAQATATIDATLGAALDRWQGNAAIATGVLAHPAATARALNGTIRFNGTPQHTGGTLDLAATTMRSAQGQARSLGLTGGYRIGRASSFVGQVRATGAAVAPALLSPVARIASSATGSPVAPLAAQLARALTAAGRGFAAEGDVAAAMLGSRGSIRVARLAVAAASGARATLADGDGLSYAWPRTGLRLDTTLAIQGGGLPTARVSLAHAAPGAPIRGRGQVARYAAGDASLALNDIVFSATPGGATRIATRATLSGPLGGGRVDGLTLPVTAFWDGRARVIANPACAPLAFQRLAISGLVLDPSRLTLCPLDGALLRIEDGRLGGGARLAAARLGGRLGSTPVTLAAGGAQVRLADRGFVVDGVATRLGGADRITRLDFDRVEGRSTPAGLAGAFAGGGGQIGNVPLILGDATGDWTLSGGKLALTGAMTVRDAATAIRFRPMAARGVTLALVDGRIDAAGTLFEPVTARKVADVRIAHALGSGIGHADLTVPGIRFDDTLQPDRLTPLTFGVIADVKGVVSGEGRIDWTPDGVTSTGSFTTPAIDLAAAFGPVTGLAGTIRFTDLLSLQSAPGQVATIKAINPGIPVTDGVIRYQTLPDTRVRVEGGYWPFAGGTLTLDPTLLDFSDTGDRRMTFRVSGAAADQFLQQFDFKNLNATGVFDGVLPMIFDAQGGRIENGQMTVRAGGGTLAYVGDLTQKDLGFWSNLAFQALRSLRYRSLSLTMNGPLAGEMVTEVRFAGISQGEGAKSNFLVRRLQRLPFVFNIRIKAPFRGLLDSAQSFYDPRRLVQRNLQSLLDEQNRRAAPPAVQPPASTLVPSP